VRCRERKRGCDDGRNNNLCLIYVRVCVWITLGSKWSRQLTWACLFSSCAVFFQSYIYGTLALLCLLLITHLIDFRSGGYV
jgi:hypothetical protein